MGSDPEIGRHCFRLPMPCAEIRGSAVTDRSEDVRLRPWGARRAMPFTGPVGTGYTRLELDPETQMTRYFDGAGQPLEMGKHGTNKATNKSESTSGGDGGEGRPPKADDVNITDYTSD